MYNISFLYSHNIRTRLYSISTEKHDYVQFVFKSWHHCLSHRGLRDTVPGQPQTAVTLLIGDLVLGIINLAQIRG